jgi:uncharacterized protein (TIGR01777 family)
MKILVTGASGFIGRALLPFLERQRHSVITLTHTRDKESETTIFWSPEEGLLDSSKIEGVEAVINLAGENIAEGRWNEEKKRRLYESRIKGTELLCRTFANMANPPKVLINSSAIGFYGDRGEELLDESSAGVESSGSSVMEKKGAAFLSLLCRDWEAAALQAQRSNVRVVILRFGMVLSRFGGALAKMLPIFKLGLGGVLGNGKQFISWIDLEDLIGVISMALTDPKMHGVYNAVAPNPVTNREFTKSLGAVLKRPTIFPVPGLILKLAMGEMAEALLLSSARVIPKRLLEANYSFLHKEITEALK